jgi:hypothetical protein
MDFTKIDKNFAVQIEIDRTGLHFYDVEEAPFRVYGVKMDNGRYRRLPEAVAAATNEGVHYLHANTAGGRVRFVTDSPRIAIHASMDGVEQSAHFAFAGKAGFDVYQNGVYRKTFIPTSTMRDGFESVIETRLSEKAEILIHFPLYANVKHLYIGLEEGSVLEPAAEYAITTPVVYYGSSITQGGCASRPGNAYQNIQSRLLNFDHINLGFSGSAKAEDAMIDYINGLEMSAFVYDYDHNAPTPAYLAETHERMFKRIRAVHPDLPILMLSRPQPTLWNPDDAARLEIVRRTYENALATGDQNVYFITGQDLMADVKNEGLVDGVHPNDAGFVSMARAMLPVLKKMLSLS